MGAWRNIKPEAERFWARVTKTPGCWLRSGASAGPSGYAVFRRARHGAMVYAHRYSWETAYGAVPQGLNVLHRCDTPRCVRPDHLFVGTQQDNVDDMMAKGRDGPRPVFRGSEHPEAKLTEEMVRRIRRDERPAKAWAAELGVTTTCVYHARNRKTWRHVE